MYFVPEGAPQHRGVAIKTSRFNHSCQPNATALLMPNGQNQIRAIKDIKEGEEINIRYEVLKRRNKILFNS